MQVKQSAVKSMETDWDFRVARGPCIKMRKAVEPVACIDSGWTGTGDQRAGGCGRRSNYLRRTARRRRARAHYAKSGLQPETTSSLTRWFKRPPPTHTTTDQGRLTFDFSPTPIDPVDTWLRLSLLFQWALPVNELLSTAYHVFC